MPKWNITENDIFKELCKQLKEHISNIKYVVYGADELVKLMIRHDPLLHSDYIKQRAIGQFDIERDKEEFREMLKDTDIWGKNQHPYTTESLDYILTITGGNPLYAKMIGNRLIEAIENGQFKSRRFIYPYDVSAVIFKMLAEQKLSLNANDKMNRFIANVTKNLEKENPYLKYIAHMMMSESNRASVTDREIYEYFGASDDKAKAEINTSLDLCAIRGILKTVSGLYGTQYSFSTFFYYIQYCELIRQEGVPEKAVKSSKIIDYDRPLSKAELAVDAVHQEIERLTLINRLFNHLTDDGIKRFNST